MNRAKHKVQTVRPMGIQAPGKVISPRAVSHLSSFLLGALLACGLLLAYCQLLNFNGLFPSSVRRDNPLANRTVAELVALSDAQLESVDLLEMNIAVAREMPGLSELRYDHYRAVLDRWTDQFRLWLSSIEHAFHEDPTRYKNDLNFFRLGMLAQFLDEQIGIAYADDEKAAEINAREEGALPAVHYADPGRLLLHGLIDTKRGTSGTMASLHASIGRRLGWPVALACADSHFVSRYDDGKTVYNIETTDTGDGGFFEGSDKEYMDKEGVSPKAVACGSDLRKLTAREMLGIFIAARARYYADAGRHDLAARDYALAYTQVPHNRRIHAALARTLLETANRLFSPEERWQSVPFPSPAGCPRASPADPSQSLIRCHSSDASDAIERPDTPNTTDAHVLDVACFLPLHYSHCSPRSRPLSDLPSMPSRMYQNTHHFPERIPL